MLRDHQTGVNPLFRNRDQIITKKESKAGRSCSSWFLKGQVRQVLMVPPTPGSKLAKRMRDQMGNLLGLDYFA